MKRTAIISECGLFRYRLSRTWDESLPRATFLMINPSKADGTIDDATIRKCIGFAKAWGYGAIEVVNLFALRSTDPDALLVSEDPIGPEHLKHFLDAIAESGLLVVAWGCDSTIKKQKRLSDQRARAIESVKKQRPDLSIKCLGFTKQGSPKHPLMLAYSTQLVEYTP